MNVLILFAGLGGESHNWEGHSLTKIEHDPKIAAINKKLHPQDTVIVTDAYQYLLDHYEEYDFIWASPPCQSHSRMINAGRNRKPRYRDFRLYEIIQFLTDKYYGKWVVENVVPGYQVLIPWTQKIGRHVMWSNCYIPTWNNPPVFKHIIKKQNLDAERALKRWLGFDYEETIYYEGNHCPTQALRNSVHPLLGEFIFISVIEDELSIQENTLTAYQFSLI